jgi:hypothetical protein
VGLERGPLNLVSIIEELLGRKSSGSGLENREYGRRDVTLTTLHPLSANLALTSPTSSGGSFGIVRSPDSDHGGFFPHISILRRCIICSTESVVKQK